MSNPTINSKERLWNKAKYQDIYGFIHPKWWNNPCSFPASIPVIQSTKKNISLTSDTRVAVFLKVLSLIFDTAHIQTRVSMEVKVQ